MIPAAPEPGAAAPGFGLYVHWPFCRAKCPYCDFNSHVRATVDEPAWRGALLRELDKGLDRLAARPLTSVFFGGGTPSLMAAATVGALLDRLAQRGILTPETEITLEANPTSVEAGRFAAYRQAGVNRVSIGVQALEDDALRFLGRQHTAQEAFDAVALAQRLFPRVSIDLIYARPAQHVAQWAGELDRALALGTEHLSLYQLTFEEGTPMGALHRAGRLMGPDEETAAQLYEWTQARCEAAGLAAYEVSNHARPGAECRHNLVYWRYGDYLGIGPGAHGRLAGQAIVNHRLPEEWLAAVHARGQGHEEVVPLSPADRGREYVLMALRLDEGLSLARVETLAGAPLEDTRIDALVEAGLLAHAGDRLRATPQGRLLLNRLVAALVD